MYDGEGKLKSANGIEYVYDAQGKRVESGAGAADTIYFAGRAIARVSGGVWTDLIYGPNGLLAEVQGSGAPTYRMTDQLGSLVGTLSSTGTVLSSQDVAPFGEIFTGATADPFIFTGKERDSESGNDYFGARYYGSSMGRFLSPDPSELFYADPTNPQSLNLYSYGRNNPLINTDPTGLDCVYINNDSGAYEDFNSGDCDNSTTVRANSGYYVDGTVNQIGFNAQGQVNGYSASSGDGVFDSFPGSQNAGVATALLNSYSGAVSSPGQTVNVNGNSPASPSLNSASISSQIPAGYKPPPPGVGVIGPNNPPAPPAPILNDPNCWGAPDAVSDIHNLGRGVLQNGPQGSTDGQFGSAIWQSTTQGNKPFGNAPADTGFNAGFMGLDYAIAVANCRQGR